MRCEIAATTVVIIGLDQMAMFVIAADSRLANAVPDFLLACLIETPLAEGLGVRDA